MTFNLVRFSAMKFDALQSANPHACLRRYSRYRRTRAFLLFHSTKKISRRAQLRLPKPSASQNVSRMDGSSTCAAIVAQGAGQRPALPGDMFRDTMIVKSALARLGEAFRNSALKCLLELLKSKSARCKI